MFPFSRRAFARTGLVVLVSTAACGVGAISFGCSREPDRATATFTAAPAAQPAQAAEGDGERPKVVFLGDSLTAGLGLVETQSYPSLLQKRIDAEELGFQIVNAGVSGDTTAGGLRRLDWALQEKNVKVLVVALGGNDALRGLSVPEMRDNLGTIVERARGKGVTVVLAGMQAPPNFGPEYTSSFRDAYLGVARQYRTPLIPFLLDKVAGRPELNQADGIHPNARGAEIMAETVWTALRPLLQQMSAQ
jgi:acyl-CoA thioesterase-1